MPCCYDVHKASLIVVFVFPGEKNFKDFIFIVGPMERMPSVGAGKMPNVGAGNWICMLCESSKSSEPLSPISRPQVPNFQQNDCKTCKERRKLY